jgi:sortase A
MVPSSVQGRSSWIAALSLLASLLITGCSPAGNAPAQAQVGVTAVRAEPLALLVLTPGILPHRDAVTRQPRMVESIRAVMAPTSSPGPQPGPTTAMPSPTTAHMPPEPTPIPIPSSSATSGPTPAPAFASTATSTPTPTRTHPSAVAPPLRPPADRPPDRIVAPAIDLDAPVVEIGWHLVERDGHMTSEWDVADRAAGFHKGSAYPGQVGNTVLSGHHNIRGEVFRDLIELQPDDLISLYVREQEYQYAVQQVLLVPEKNAPSEQRRENARWIGDFPDERMTLVTCWPYTGNTHRVIVVAYPPGSGS